MRSFLQLFPLLACLLAGPPASAQPRHLWHDYPVAGRTRGTLTAVIEIPKGSRRKLEVDKRPLPVGGALFLDRRIQTRGYPLNYGFIPRTMYQDGDPLDVMVIGGKAARPGSVVNARLIGLMEMTDTGVRDSKLLAVDATSRRFARVTSVQDLPQGLQQDLRDFFEHYKQAQGKTVTVGAFGGLRSARACLGWSRRRYQQKFGPEPSSATRGNPTSSSIPSR
jgi:inorganic pyrophosphatase